MADLKTTNIYGDAYINNKVGIATNAPATRLQIGQLSPTAATEGIQFGDDTSTRIYRIGAGSLILSSSISTVGTITSTYGTFSAPGISIGDGQYGFYITSGNLTYKSAAGGAHYWRNIANSANTLTLDNSGNLTAAGTITAPSATVSGYITFPNDTTAAGLINTANTAWLRLDDGGGNMHMGNVQSGAGIYCDSNAFYWRTINGATTLLSLNSNGDLGAARYLSGTYVTTSDDTSSTTVSYIMAKFGDNFHRSAPAAKVATFLSGQTMNIVGTSTNITAYTINQNVGTANTPSFAGVISSAVTGYAYLQVVDVNNFWITPGNVNWGLYFETSAGGLLGGTGDSNRLGFVGSGAARFYVDLNNGNGWFGGTLTAVGNISGANLSGTNTGDQSIGNGTITIAAGTGVSVGATNTFTTNQSGATTVTVTNTGVTSVSAGTGIGTSASTGAVTITNGGVTSAVAGTGVGVSAGTGAVTFSIGQAVGTANSPTFVAVTTSTDGANHIMAGSANAEGIRMTPASSTTYPVFLRSTNPGSGGEASPWIYKEAATEWGIWHNNPVNSIDFTKAGSGGIASNVGGGTNTVVVRVDMGTGYVQTIAGYRNSAGTTILDNSGNITGNAATATNVAWSGITSKPTTLSGFGITDAASINGASNQNFSANSIYQYEWLRIMADSGIYWQSGTYAGFHIHPQAAWGMSFRSAAATDCGLQLRRSDATSLGAVYADGTSIGFLTAAFGWGASFTVAGVMNRGSVPGSLVTGNISGNAGTVTNGIYTTSVIYIGTTAITMSRSSAAQTLTGVNIDGYANYISAQTNPIGAFNVGLTRPKGASYTTTASSVTGAIKIKMPPGIPVHGMWKMTIKIYEYGSRGNGYTIECGCHLYPSTAYNRYQYAIGVDANIALTIRYGTDGTSGCIWIGENATTWSYPQIHVTEFSNGFNNPGNPDWNAGTWGVTIGTIDNSVAVDGPYTIGLPLASSATSATTAGSISGFNNPVTAATANTIVYRDGGGDISTRYFLGSYVNSTDDTSSTGITYIMAKFGNDYHRSATAAKVATFISGQTMSIAGSSTSCTGNAATATALTSMNISQFTNNSGYLTSVTNISGNAATATTTDNINGRAFYNRDSGNALGQDSYTNNGVGYVNGVSLYSQTDGGMYASAYSTSWVHQIYGDFRTGQIAVRGKNNGTLQAWRNVLDSSNYTSYSPTLTGTGASGTWSINVTGTAGSISGFNNPAVAATANTIVYRSGGGDITGAYILGSYFNASAGNSENPTIGQIWTQNTTDNYLRKSTPAHFRSQVTDGSYPSLTGANASGTWSINVTGNAGTATTAVSATSLAADTSTRFKIITFTGVGGDSGNGSLPDSYAIYQQGGSWTHPYPDLCIGYHTGIKIGAYLGYGGTRFYNNSDWATEIFSVGNGDSNVRVVNTIYATTFSGAGTGLTGTAASLSIGGAAASATFLNSSNYIQRIGGSGNYNTDFQNTPAGSVRHQGDDANSISNPGATWWFVDNYRHSNSSNYWGTQVAWGWEDNANRLATRNVSGGGYGGWVYYLNSANYNSYSPTLTGTGASGTWSINVTGNAGGSSTSCSGNAATATALTSMNISQFTNNSGYLTSVTNISGNAATATTATNVGVGSGNTSAAWYPVVWHSGNTLFSSAGVQIYAGNNYVQATYFNSSDNDETGITRFVIKNGDGYHRSATTTSAADIIRGVASGTWSITAATANALNTGNTYQVANIGIGVSPSNRLHINGDGVNPTIRIDNTVFGTGSSNSRVFYGWLPISINAFGTVSTKYIQLYNSF